jgi:hypothetical protein
VRQPEQALEGYLPGLFKSFQAAQGNAGPAGQLCLGIAFFLRSALCRAAVSASMLPGVLSMLYGFIIVNIFAKNTKNSLNDQNNSYF